MSEEIRSYGIVGTLGPIVPNIDLRTSIFLFSFLPTKLPLCLIIKYRAIAAATKFLKNVFWKLGKSPDSFINADITANPHADVIIQSIPFILFDFISFSIF